MPRKADGLISMTLRLRQDLHQRLADAAKCQGVSLNVEVGNCAQRWLDFEAAHAGPATSEVLHRIALMIADIERDTGAAWMDDFATFEAVRAALPDAIEKLMTFHMPHAPNEEQALITSLAFDETREIIGDMRPALVEAGIVPAGRISEMALGVNESAIDQLPSGEPRSAAEADMLRSKLKLYRQALQVERQLKQRSGELLVPMREQQQRGRDTARRVLDALDAALVEEQFDGAQI